MKDKSISFLVPHTTLYRVVAEKCVVIEVNSGRIYYFNPESEAFFDYFSSGNSLDEYLTLAQQSGTETEAKYVRQFIRKLVKRGILTQEKRQGAASAEKISKPYQRPVYIGVDPNTLDEIQFVCP